VNESATDRQSRGWDLNAWRFNGRAPTISLRAAGNLLVAGSISDGFAKVPSGEAMPDWTLSDSSQSSSLRLVGGADLIAANPLAVKASQANGDVAIRFARSPNADDPPVALVRTGTGRIEMAAGRDVVLEKVTLPDPDGDITLNRDFGAAVYTAGRAAALAPDFQVPMNKVNAQYGSDRSSGAAFGHEGGGISVSAQRDVVGAPMASLVNSWLFRQGRSGSTGSGEQVFETVGSQAQKPTALGTAWWSRPDYFAQGFATFGGGDLSISAVMGSVRDVSANVATNAYVAGPSAQSGKLVEQGGGDLTVAAGSNIAGGQFYVQKGAARLHANGAVTTGSFAAVDSLAPSQQDSQGNDVPVYAALRPVLAVGNASFDISAGGRLEIETSYNPTLARQSINNVFGIDGLDPDTAFLSYSNRSSDALDFKSRFAQFSAFSTYGARSAVRLTAVGGDLTLNNNAKLVANSGAADVSNVGQVAVLSQALYGYMASRIQASSLSGNLASSQGFSMASARDGQLELLAKGSVSLANNAVLFNGINVLDNDPASVSTVKTPSPLRSTDVNLLSGAATGLLAHAAGQLHSQDDQPVRIVALTGSVTGQANTATSLILPKSAEILAGVDIRDVGFSIQHSRTGDTSLVQAGRDIINTTNLSQASPVKQYVTGAGLLVMNAGRDINLGNSQGVVTRGNLDNAYLPQGGASVEAVAGFSLSPEAAKTNPFDRLASNEAFFKALVDASKLPSLANFDAAIESAFPLASISGGDISVFGSQFKTEQGGSLDLLAPGGSVIAGLVSVPGYLLNKSDAEKGIFTVRGGAIRSLVKKDFTVNQGRVFTLGGGDITLVSQYGNIDAGRGTKTASSAPPPLLTTDASGNTKLDIAGSIAGSGIATLRTSDTQAPSNVYAVAPRGIFDAGDAGVRSTGVVTIQAAVVLNAGNIQASGGVAGSGAVTASSGAAAPAPSNTGGTAAQEATRQLATAPKETLGLSVEVLGYGESDDADDPNDTDEERKRKRASRAKKP
jgi:hypothetical protein